LLGCLGCLWFDRKDANDRLIVGKKIKEHVADTTKLPLLLFPEGTCVNNDYCIMFKKGAFELGATVYPVAIRYNKLFCDPFYNSREQSFIKHAFRLLTNWAVVCDVWYMDPCTIKEGETDVDFANRVKRKIANKAKLTIVIWDGYLLYFKPSERFVDEKRKLFANRINQRFSSQNLVQMEKNMSTLKKVK